MAGCLSVGQLPERSSDTWRATDKTNIQEFETLGHLTAQATASPANYWRR